MNYSENDTIHDLETYFFSAKNNEVQVLYNDKNEFIGILSTFIEAYKDDLVDKKMDILNLLETIYTDCKIDIKNKPLLIRKFIDETSSYSSIGIFAQDELLSCSLKNLYMFDLVEKIRFSKLQKESLRDTSTYNRHIAKSLTEMRNCLIVLFELKSEYEEVLAILDKYFEFNCYVNTPKCWIEFHTLREYPHFEKYLITKEDTLRTLYKNGNLDFEAVRNIVMR